MRRTSLAAARSAGCLLSFTLGIASFDPTAVLAGGTWDGGGSTNNWSDRFNWVGDGTPSGIGTLVFGTQGGVGTENLFNVSGGFADSSFSGIQFTSGSFNIIPGSVSSALGVADNGRVAAETGPFGAASYDISVPLVTSGRLRVDVVTLGTLNLANIVERPGATTDLQVGADASHAGTLRVYSASYTGATTVNNGTLLLGDLGTSIHTQNQADYAIAAGASLFANGTIGLATGARVANSGTIGISGDSFNRQLSVSGDVVMSAASTYVADLVGPVQDPWESHPMNVS